MPPLPQSAAHLHNRKCRGGAGPGRGAERGKWTRKPIDDMCYTCARRRSRHSRHSRPGTLLHTHKGAEPRPSAAGSRVGLAGPRINTRRQGSAQPDREAKPEQSRSADPIRFDSIRSDSTRSPLATRGGPDSRPGHRCCERPIRDLREDGLGDPPRPPDRWHRDPPEGEGPPTWRRGRQAAAAVSPPAPPYHCQGGVGGRAGRGLAWPCHATSPARCCQPRHARHAFQQVARTHRELHNRWSGGRRRGCKVGALPPPPSQPHRLPV